MELVYKLKSLNELNECGLNSMIILQLILAMFVSHFENKLKEATNAKSRGTDHFKANRYPQAIQDYQMALQLVQPHLYYGAAEAQFSKSVELRVTLIFNIGLCHFNQKMLRLAEQKFSEAIAINPQYVKAIYKRALTRQLRDDYEGAMVDIKQVCELNNDSRDFRQAQERISKKYDLIMRKDNDGKKKLDEQGKKESKQSKKQTKKQKKQQVIENDQSDSKRGNRILWTLGIMSIAGIGLYQYLKKQ